MSDVDSRAGKNYYTEAIHRFVEDLYSPAEPGLDYALAAMKENGMPEIQVAPTDGKILTVLLKMINAKKVVELGTLSGYSALWMLKGMPENGHIWTLEYDPIHARVAADVFMRAGVDKKVDIMSGAALEKLDDISEFGPFDAVFLDADKINYLQYAKWALDNIRPGGLLIADNAYLFGFLDGEEPDDEHSAEEIENMQAFHRLLADKTTAVCLPTPDGMAVGILP